MDTPADLSLDDALRMAMAMHREDQLEGAAELYARILAAAPGHPDALNLLGMARHQMGRSDEGVALIEQAIATQPGFAGFHNNLGNVQMQRGAPAAAAAAYERAIALAPHDADAHSNLGALYKALNRPQEAQAALARAIELNPHHINAINNLGLLYAKLGEREQAIRCYLRALELMPDHRHARKLLGTTYYALGRIADAAEVYRQWLELEPANPQARHLLAACTGQAVPARADDAFVEQTFDGFAASFEQVLGERLAYQAPQRCAQLLARLLPPPARQFSVLDAGVGTGLCGPLLAPWARHLAGVDLSRNMLNVARTKGVYDALHKAELTAFLQAAPAPWQVMVSADTLCYFGDLHAVLAAAAGALAPGGTLVFTVEALADDSPLPHQLQPHGRYAHHARHLDAALVAAGLTPLAREAAVLRQESGKPVQGWVVAARR